MKSRTGVVCALARKRIDPAQILVRLAIRRALVGCASALDVGCGSKSWTLRDLELSNTAGIEAYEPAFLEARRLNTHDHLVLGDARDLVRWFKPRQFDACIAIDLIEHLNKEDGLRLMRQMEQIALKRVVLFTPNGFLPQGHREPGDLQTHLSGWGPDEMNGYGYRVYGQLGPKGLRGEHHVLKRRPAIAWGLVSLLGHFFWTQRHPGAAAAILCVKDLEATPVPHPQGAVAQRKSDFASCRPLAPT
jgi:hypothetical protein